MREIKFKVIKKYPDGKTKFVGYETIIDGCWAVSFGGEDWETATYRNENPGELIRLQYIGLKDKNGKEVYEGDIVGVFSDKDNTDYDNKPSKWLQVVKWDEESYVWRIWDQEVKTSFETMYVSDWDGDILDLGMLENPEVIGNIYEDPELLEKAA